MANTSFSELKKSRQTQLDKLTQEFQKVSTPQQNANNGKDERLWEPSVDKAGNGYAIIRFLPAPKGEDIPFVRVFSHGFQSKETGSWYIENCLTSLGQKCPCCEINNKLWNSGLESDKNIARDQKRRLSFYSNILVVKDPNNPNNEGKVFLFKYGKKIFDKLNDLMNPEFDDEEPVNPFDFWDGCNFKLKIRQVEGYRNYDKSEFDKPSAISSDDIELENIWKSEHSLQAFLEPKNFKSYDDLKGRLNRVLGLDTPVTNDIPEQHEPVQKSKPATKSKVVEPDDEESEDFDTLINQLTKD